MNFFMERLHRRQASMPELQPVRSWGIDERHSNHLAFYSSVEPGLQSGSHGLDNFGVRGIATLPVRQVLATGKRR